MSPVFGPGRGRVEQGDGGGAFSVAQEQMRSARHRGIPQQGQTLGPLAPEPVPLTAALAGSPRGDRDKQLRCPGMISCEQEALEPWHGVPPGQGMCTTVTWWLRWPGRCLPALNANYLLCQWVGRKKIKRAPFALSLEVGKWVQGSPRPPCSVTTSCRCRLVL